MSDDSPAPRYAAYEWFGHRISDLDNETRQEFLAESDKSSPDVECPFRPKKDGERQNCNKEGGVCSIRKLSRKEDKETGEPIGPIVTNCPERFKEDNLIFEWVSNTVLGTKEYWKESEVDFLEPHFHHKRSDLLGNPSSDEIERQKGVGQIDGVLVDAEHYLNEEFELRNWCGLEIQSVYFQGDARTDIYDQIAELEKPKIPFPKNNRNPDFRSSSVKRLLPQLQTQVPSMRRWGVKMAVVVDEVFFYSMAEMDEVDDISNCDIAWFVVQYSEDEDGLSIESEQPHLTTLEDAVVGLTAGTPVSKQEFEDRLMRQFIDDYVDSLIDHLQDKITQNTSHRKAINEEEETRFRRLKRPLTEERSRLLKLEEKGKLTRDQEKRLSRLRDIIFELDESMKPYKERVKRFKRVMRALRSEKRRLQKKEVDGSNHTIDDELWKRHGNRWIRKDRNFKDKCDRPPPSPDDTDE